MTEFFIPLERKTELFARIGKLNKKASRFNCEPIMLTIVREETRTMYRDVDNQLHREKVRGIVYEVAGSPPVVGEFELVATVQLIDGENIIRTVPNGPALPVEYRAATDWCDHCRSRRGRKDVIIVRNTNTNEFKQVGRNCVVDYLGRSAEQEIGRFSLLTSIHSDLENYGKLGTISWDQVPQDIFDVCAAAMATIRVTGWVSKAKARDSESVTATCYYVQDTLAHQHGRWKASTYKGQKLPWYQNIETPPTPTDEDRATAESAISWVLNFSEKDVENDYLYNLRAICRNEFVDSRSFALAASLVPAYQRAMGLIEARKQAAANSEHVGIIKERRAFELTVNRLHYINGAYGVTTLHTMTDKDGNVFKWFASNAELEVGKTYNITGTIKEHSMFNNIKETVITRCKVAE